MLATNPMPGNPSIRTGSFRTGFSVRLIVQTKFDSLSDVSVLLGSSW